ncbi:MAG TPA: DUF1552 domain-containing protein [Polyangiaceae bacterium]|jgi:hypothetical protein|nr:DUF1552 domain-containing protein [Polyangiaceae bacterium]
MTTRTITRRTLLGGLGAGILGLPFLSRIPSAEAQSNPKRFVVFFTPNESIDKQFWQPGAGMALKPMMQPLDAYKDKLVVIGDLAMQSRLDDPWQGGHIGTGHVLVGRKVIPYGTSEGEHYASGVSVDQYIADKLGVPSMVVGARCGGSNGNGRISYLGANQPVHPVEDPIKSFDQTLGDYTLPPDELAALRAQRGSVLDTVAGHIDGLKGKLGTLDANKLDMHLDRVRELELELQQGGVISCNPVAPADDFDHLSNAAFPVTIRRHIDVVTQALACDVTRVASIQVGNSGTSHVTPTWPSEGIDINVDAHNISHNYNNDQNTTNTQRRVALETWYFKQFAYLLQKLSSVDEGDGTTLLDNTLVLWCKPIGRRHNVNQMLFILAGGAGGALTGGRYVEFVGEPHNRLLISCCQLMGLTDETFGDPAYCSDGPLNL